MAKYTTGDVAQHCGITVRTVQYYDERGILSPSETSEGGRRIYSEDDLKRMKAVCVLRELGLSLKTIKALLEDDHPEQAIQFFLAEQEKTLRKDIEERQETLHKLERMKRQMNSMETLSLESIGDAASTLQGSKKLHHLYALIFITGVPLNILQWGSIFWWIFNDSWVPFAIWAVMAVPYTLWIIRTYISRVAYICPHCHEVFIPSFKEAVFAKHTLTLRRLTCTHCGKKDFCIEIYREEDL